MNRFLCSVLICILVPFISVQRVFAEEEESDLPFTDVVVDQLVDITSSVDSSWLNMVTEKKTIVDEVIVETAQGQFQTLTPYGNTINIVGSYYDNTISGIQQCTGSSYNYQTQNHVVEGVAVVGLEFGAGLNHSAQNMLLNGMFDISTNVGASETTTTNSFTNSTEACALMGMNSGDGAVDGTVLLELGYTQQTVTYNDGTTNGHTATVYVPGNESINLSIDSEFITDLIDNIVVNIIQSAIYIYHTDYSMYLEARPGYYIPEYGQLKSRSYILNMFYPPFNADNFEATFDPNLSGSGVTAQYDESFNDTIMTSNDGDYYFAQTVLTWQGNNNPYWYFTGDSKTVSYNQMSQVFVDSDISIQTTNNCLSQQWGSITSSLIDDYPDLTLNTRYGRKASFYDYHFWKYQDSGRLGLFNQLGTFLNNWFTRIKTSIDSITGNQDVVQQIENDYNVDFDTSINNYIQNIQNTSQQIDLTAPQNNLPQGNHLSEFAPVVSETLKVFTDNGVWIFIFVPILIAILGLIL